MPIAEFEEKSYEIAMAIELSAERGFVLPPGQVAEKVLGYDAAATPSPSNSIWGVLGVKRPNGLVLIPPLWATGVRPAASRLPTVPISLILQYKRPEYLSAPQAKQWKLWGRPYFRFQRTPHQHRALAQLERSIGTRGLVRYASPAFWQYTELEAASLRRQVATSSGYVSPGALGRHHVWTYRVPGSVGRPNPSGAAVDFETLDRLRELRGVVADQGNSQAAVEQLGDPLLAHLAVLGEASRHRRPWLRQLVTAWRASLLRDQPDLSVEQIDGLCNIASTVTLTQSMGASWGIMAGT